MSTLFFYGTLRHHPLLEIVLGRALSSDEVTEGVAEDHSVCGVVGGDYPVIVEGGEGALGIVVEGLSDTEIERLNFYEGGFDYALKELSITCENGLKLAQVFFPFPDRITPAGPWDLNAWKEKWAALTCIAATEAMSYFGKKTHAELDFMFPSIRARAAQKLIAPTESHAYSPSEFTREDVKLQKLERPHAGFFNLEEHTVSHKTYGGGEITGMIREIFVGTDAAILLPYDPKRDRVLLVEQFRAGPWARHDPSPWMLEPIAGRVDPGETAAQSAVREAREEANIDINDLHAIAKVYASPGCSTEFFHIFVGVADLPDDVVGIGGLDNEHEDIKSYLFDFDELMKMVDNFQAGNSPLVLAALWLARRRDALRAAA